MLRNSADPSLAVSHSKQVKQVESTNGKLAPRKELVALQSRGCHNIPPTCVDCPSCTVSVYLSCLLHHLCHCVVNAVLSWKLSVPLSLAGPSRSTGSCAHAWARGREGGNAGPAYTVLHLPNHFDIIHTVSVHIHAHTYIHTPPNTRVPVLRPALQLCQTSELSRPLRGTFV